MITFNCTSCGRPFAVPNLGAGKRITCPDCQYRIVIPDAARPTVPVLSVVETVSAPRKNWAGRVMAVLIGLPLLFRKRATPPR
jgi:DNA-directed RNA polymerase subunit RPC12/RpoP